MPKAGTTTGDETIRAAPEVEASLAACDHRGAMDACRRALARTARDDRTRPHIHLAIIALDHGCEADLHDALEAIAGRSDPKAASGLVCFLQWGLCALLLARLGRRDEARTPARMALSTLDRRAAAVHGHGDRWDAIERLLRPERRKAQPLGILARARRKAGIGS